MPVRYNPPPTWPPPPAGWKPEPGWQPDPTWGPPPPDWQLWVQDGSSTTAARAQWLVTRVYLGPTRSVTRRSIRATLLVLLTLVVVSVPFSDSSTDRAATANSKATQTIASPAAAEPSAAPTPAQTSAAAPTPTPAPAPPPTVDEVIASAAPKTALAALGQLPVKGRAPSTGYSRAAFGQKWADTDRNGCDTRNDVLRRDVTDESLKAGTRGCVVLSGMLADPFSGRRIEFVRGESTSSDVQIDHVVALADAWQKGAQRWHVRKRTAFANDPLNLLAVDGGLNAQKGAGDAATWLPPHKAFRCRYVARQVAVKVKYGVWVTQAERAAIARVLATCESEPTPTSAHPTLAPADPLPKPSPSRKPAPAPAPKKKCDPSYPDFCLEPGIPDLDCGEIQYRRFTVLAPDPHGFDRDNDGVGCESG
jgi:hypothetical protein